VLQGEALSGALLARLQKDWKRPAFCGAFLLVGIGEK
jgi:hypothetical protein